MFLEIEDFLGPAAAGQVAELARQARFVDGRRSNPHNIAKNSLIIDPDPLGQPASQIALTAFQRHEQARDFVFPQRIAIPQLARYGTGMSHGVHTDAPFLPSGQQLPLRSDVSCTVLISVGSWQARASGVLSLDDPPSGDSGDLRRASCSPSSRARSPMSGNAICSTCSTKCGRSRGSIWRSRTRLEHVSANLHRMWAK